VGGKTVKMASLRALYESLGLQDVESYIQSGNVLFNAEEKNVDKLRMRIEGEIQKKFGLTVSVIMRKPEEIRKILDSNPFLKKYPDETKKMYVTLLERKPSEELIVNLAPSKTTEDKFKILNREVYIFCLNGYGRTVLTNDFFEKKLKLKATTRNWRTLNKLYDLSGD